MTYQREALARSRAYGLLGRVFGRGLTPDLLEGVAAVPEMASALPAPRPDPDQAAADHHDLFGFNVFPYASLFLDASGQLGGAVTEGVRRQYARGGFRVDDRAESPDAIEHELRFLGTLAGAEAGAWADRAVTEAERLQNLQCRFLDEHLLWWVPAFVQAVRQQEYPAYAHLAGLMLDLLIDHRTALGQGPAGAAEVLLPEPPDLLADPKTGLKEIAAYLVTPPWSGLYLSRSDIARLGRSERLPRGFGERSLMLTNLLRSAAEYDSLASLLEALLGLIRSWEAHYTHLLETELPSLEAAARLWLDRLARTEAVLQQVRAAAAV